jgi:hypothetical protein
MRSGHPAPRPLKDPRGPERAPDRLSGVFLYWGETLAGGSANDWDERLAFLRQLGMDTLIVQFSVIEGVAFYRSRRSPNAVSDGDPTAVLLTAADGAGFGVHLGLASDEQHWWKIPYQPAELPDYVARESERNNAISRELVELYGEHRSLAGIYLSHEIHLGDEWSGDNMPYLVGLFNAMSDEAKRLAPRQAVSTAPFFSLRGTIEEYEGRWREFLSQTRLDILMLQDGVGCKRHITVDNMVPYYEALARVCRDTGVDLWSDLELFDLNDPAAATPDRIAAQLVRAAPYVSKIVAYSLANLTPELAASLPGVRAG